MRPGDQSALRATLRRNRFGFNAMSKPDCVAGSAAPQSYGLLPSRVATSIFIFSG